VNVDANDKEELDRAYKLAVDAHSEQRRKSGEPYIFHPIAVAKISAEEIGLGATSIISALLHDVVEDTPITSAQIHEQFGKTIGKIVDGLTKLDSAYNANSPQAENFKKILRTLVEDVRVVLVKMADRLHNMRTLGAMPMHKQMKIAAETSFLYAPLAHRLGLYAFKTEYLDLCMKVTDREAYSEIAKKLAATKRDREAYIEAFITPLKERLDQIGVPYKIFGRPKSIYSIWNKIKSKGVTFEEIYDLFAVRIVLELPMKSPMSDEKMVCWRAYSIVTDVHTPIPERIKDWITTPKSNGYESLHTTVIGPKGRYVEVQIRTERMDQIAEKGFAAHWKYKGVSTDGNDVYDKWLNSVREILDAPNMDAVEFLGEFKENHLFNEEVFVYTPNGDMKILPKGATALDFAFSIHSDVGYRCTAVKVNNKLVPLSAKLKNGDQVTVVTSPKQKPSESWLKMVVTGKAKSKIKSSMKEEKRKVGEIGMEAMKRKLKNLKVQYEESMETLIAYFKYESYVDLFYDIATDKFQIAQIAKHFNVEAGKLVPKGKEEENTTPKQTHDHLTPHQQEVKTAENTKLLINGEPGEKYTYSFANCCNPVQGDPIFAFLTISSGLKIHRSSCPNSTNLMANYGYRIMTAEWVNTANASFVAHLTIKGVDKGKIGRAH
ncbi:MAG TPA: bifunctional (p)ppGpp synthetase/guanosine-3',5'-bis(diphosphate) 3'-pyrophosphohydrolase, partial [Saprospiraceae bacterium]|nr:bifunctional (p)ppGpp synthetase/guanosine-3',5'-bis(diphosphate) 3'-pyrophosphohydrolase [Saprospiraceae bacterium]